MDSSTIILAVVSAIIGACILLLIYMAARTGGYDGAKDYAEEQERGKKP